MTIDGRPDTIDATQRLDELLALMLGPDARFRVGQREAVETLVRDRGRVLVVQRTGWGKSLVYLMATRLLSDQGAGPTLLISPLLSLVRNQVAMAERLGIRSATINSTNRDDWTDIEAEIENDELDLLLVAPERFANEDFTTRVMPSIKTAIGMLVVDEAHCISDWGHDFRPDYRRIKRILDVTPERTPVLATTATANSRVIDDVASQLGEHVTVLRGPLGRDSISLRVLTLEDPAERMAWLARWLPRIPGSGIVYCLTIADTERVARWLRHNGIAAEAYHAGLPPEERPVLEQRLLDNEVKCLVATVALGMGFDKPDLGFVVHYQRPGSVVAYYQQVGRAGRAVDRALGLLMTGREDDEIAAYFIESAFPPQVHSEAVIEALETGGPLSVPKLERRLNLRRGQIDQALKLLEIDGAVRRDSGQWSRTAEPWRYEAERIEAITALRRTELEEMRTYTLHEGCLMAFLTAALDDPSGGVCGRCEVEGGPPLPRELEAELVEKAIAFLRRDARPLEPRLRWAAGGSAGLSGAIDLPNEPGFALSVYRDAGWGRMVAEGRIGRKRFDDALVRAAAGLVRDSWRPDPAPTWVTVVPSSRGELLRDLGERVARGARAAVRGGPGAGSRGPIPAVDGELDASAGERRGEPEPGGRRARGPGRCSSTTSSTRAGRSPTRAGCCGRGSASGLPAGAGGGRVPGGIRPTG